MQFGAVMAWSNTTWYYVSMAYWGTAVAPLITHWSCCSLAVGHQYNTVATGLGREQSSNKKDIPHPAPTGKLWDVCFCFLRIYEIYHAMTAPQPHWNFVCLFFPKRCTCCTPRTYNFVLAMYHLHWLMLYYQAAENANENKLHFDFFIIIIFILFFLFLLAPPDICFVWQILGHISQGF